MEFYSRRQRWIIAIVLAALTAPLALLAFGLQPRERHRVADVTRVTVEPGMSIHAIAQTLSQQRLIAGPLAFRVLARLRRSALKIKAGVYEFAPTDSPATMLAKLEAGETADVKVTLIEGWTTAQMGQVLAKVQILPADALVAASILPLNQLLPGKEYDFLADRPDSAGLEGYLFPDTYKFLRSSQPGEVVSKMLDDFGRRVTPELRERIRLQGRTLFEVVTLASIVEKEVNSEQDRRMVADIFWRRLAIGKPLESDATVNYVTGKGLASPSIDDTQVDSLYNTYRHTGLPPGPIDNPGLESIQAVADPLPNDYLYFLSGTDGLTHYAKTYDEHLNNKALYLK